VPYCRPYGCRTTRVRALSVSAGALPLHTGGMADSGLTALVTGSRDSSAQSRSSLRPHSSKKPSKPSDRFTSSGERPLPPVPTIGECFDDVVVPQLDAAHRLARWLMRNEHDAEDVVQEASLRALRYFRTFTGGNGRAWFLRIVRNTCTGWPGHRRHLPADTFDEERHGGAEAAADPETLLIQNHAAAALDQALVHLPDRVRELLILRELKGLSYREIADVMGIPMGTVMSSLSRARQALRSVLNDQLKQSGIPKRTHPREQEAEAVLV
jgi:RNA polymerase sigma-70 factor, ECF subfamily